MSNHPLLFGTVSPTETPPRSAGPRPPWRNHPLLFGTVSPTEEARDVFASVFQVTTPYCSGLSLLPAIGVLVGTLVIFVTTPYCSGLSLLPSSNCLPRNGAFSNHPLLFGTVSPTKEFTCPDCGERFGNHPLLFGTVSPTQHPVGAYHRSTDK